MQSELLTYRYIQMTDTTDRNSYLISRALRDFLFASLLTSAASQVAIAIDAIIVSHFVGPNALSAINLSTPIITIIAAFSLLFGTGASMLAAKSIGNQQIEQVKHIFTVAIISVSVVGVIISALLFLFHHTIISQICPNAQIAPFVEKYLLIMMVGGTLPLFLSYTLNAFIQSDGAPGVVTQAVITGGLVNIVLDLLLVGWLQMGITGAAIATVTNYLIAIIFLLPRLLSKHSCYRWQIPHGAMLLTTLKNNISEGLPMMIGNLMLGAIVLVINSIILAVLGSEGMFAWSICLQVLLLSVVLLNGIGNAIFSIGGMFVGQQDYAGLTLLVRKLLTIIVIILLAFTLFVLIYPSAIAMLFSANTPERVEYLSSVLRIFSLVLIPFALTTVMRSLFQILEYRFLSIFLAISQLLVMAIVVGITAYLSPKHLWWGFPLSALMLISLQFIITMAISYRSAATHHLSAFTLIPAEIKGKSKSYSVAYNMEAAMRVINDIQLFLQQNDISKQQLNNIMLVCEEMTKNVVQHTQGHARKHYFDLQFHITDEQLSFIMNDAGQPFNPLAKMEEMKGKKDYEHLGLTLASGQKEMLSYKYMFGQNILFGKFKKKE